MDYSTLPVNEWDENHVKCWLESTGIKEEYVEKLYAEEVTGPALMTLDKSFLKELGMKKGQIQILICKRNELLQGQDETRQDKNSSSKTPETTAANTEPVRDSPAPAPSTAGGGTCDATATTTSGNTAPTSGKRQRKNKKSQLPSSDEVWELRNCRPFRSQDADFKYVKDTVLTPESGVSDLITPCHEYKSLATASELTTDRLQPKFASEVIRFASACMNVRTNGTIHFGVMDSVEDKGCKHGQVVGIRVTKQEDYIDGLDKYIQKCFCDNLQEIARKCIHTPVFVEVISKDSQEQRFVVEVDIEPTSILVKNHCFEVYLPSYSESSNKVILTKERALYQRVGAKSEPVERNKLIAFTQAMQDRNAQREKAELSSAQVHTEIPEDLGRKLSILLNDGKSYMDDSLWYILVTNRCEQDNLNHMDFLMYLNIFCVFDFDEHSNVSGLHSKYKEHHQTSSYFLPDFFNEIKTDNAHSQKLFDQTSWIFCNGRSDFHGDENFPCDETTWIREKKKFLKKVITCICEEILPERSFIVLFLLLSPVQKPLAHAFEEFYSEMNGTEYIICIAESSENYGKWANLAQVSCSMETLAQRSVVGMKLSHVDATIQAMLPSTAQPRHLPVSTGGVCSLSLREEEKLYSLEILCADQCDDINVNLWSEKQIQEIEQNFYRGRKITWENLWLSDRRRCGDIIEREACEAASKLLDGISRGSVPFYPVAKLKIFHHPGSGGSTIARQVLWKSRKHFRCAVIKTSYPPSTVCSHVLALRDYEEREITHCFPVLLLIEDYDDEYLEELQTELMDAVAIRKMNTPKPYFILICCRRCNDPERLCKASPLDTVAVTHKLTESEKSLFSTKLEKFQQKDIKTEFILTFVLMCKEFNATYVSDLVAHILQGIDLHCRDTCLMRYMALLNCYVHGSYLSLSHCEAFLGLGAYAESKTKPYNFKYNLSEQARIFFVELRESTTHILSVRIIHPVVAKEILHQLAGNESLSQLATTLLQEKTLFENRFARQDFIKFIRHLFIRRDKRSRGDNADTFFSPFIEHVCETEDCEKAIAVLKAAYELLGKDPFFAQQLARLNYSNEKFEHAEHWATVAKSHLPNDSFILDTEGQVYRKWFSFTVDKMTEEEDTPEMIIRKIEIALKAMKCFQAAQQAAKAEREIMNNAGYFGEVEVGCRLLWFLSTLPVFRTSPEQEHTELVKYLTTDYIPEDIRRTWGRLHSRLKGLRQNLYNALEWISEELSYFQTDKKQEEDDIDDEKEEQIYKPRKWLRKQSKNFAKFFKSASLLEDSNTGHETQLIRQMSIYEMGGGNVTNILSFLTDKDKPAEKLETIISLYRDNALGDRLEDNDLINYILCHITLACLAPGSAKLLPLQTLRKLSLRFFNAKRPFPASAYFLLTLLYWPDEALDREPNPDKNEILTSALQTLKNLHDIKMKDVPSRRRRIYTHFFLGKGYGFSKIVHKSKIDKLIPGHLYDRRMKWLHGTVWNIPKIRDNLKRVSGWTKDRNVFVRGHTRELHILPLHYESLPAGNENVTFYLGFSFSGLIAFNIEVENDAASSGT